MRICKPSRQDEFISPTRLILCNNTSTYATYVTNATYKYSLFGATNDSKRKSPPKTEKDCLEGEIDIFAFDI